MLPERASEMLGLDERVDDSRQLGDVDPISHLPEGLRAALADPELGENEQELLDERAFEVLAEARESGVETEAGLDADRQDVEGIGQLAPHLLTALVRPVCDDGVGAEEADRTAGERRRELPLGPPGSAPSRTPSATPTAPRTTLRREETQPERCSERGPPKRA